MAMEEICTNSVILSNIGYLNVWDNQNYRVAGTRIREELYQVVSPYTDILGVCIVTKTGEMIFQDKISQSNVERFVVPSGNLRYSDIYQKTISTHEFLYHPTERRENGDYGVYRLMVVSQSIPDYMGPSDKNVAIVVLYIDENAVSKLLDTRRKSSVSVSFLTDADGRVLSSHYEEAIGTVLEGVYDSVEGMDGAVCLAKQILSQNNVQATACRALESGRLKLYCVMQADSTVAATKTATVSTLIFAVLLIGVNFAVVWRYSKRIGHDVENILYTMDLANRGKLDARSDVSRADEFGAISAHLNHMLDEIHLLLMRMAEAKDQQRTAEIQALEAQINPHFMFNTLDSINWMAIENGQFEISQMLKYLSEFFRYAVRNSSETVEVRTEVEHLRQYIYLQQRRYAYAFSCHVRVEKETERCRIHKLLLQPLVENALLHGFDFTEPDDSRENVIDIEVFSDTPEMLTLRVCDNGKGMESLMMHELNTYDVSKYNLGKAIGVRNVIARVRMYYGARG